MVENSGDFASGCMYLREIIFFHEKVENYTSSTMISEKLNGIALMHVHQEIICDTEKVTDIYTGQKRWLTFT